MGTAQVIVYFLRFLDIAVVQVLQTKGCAARGHRTVSSPVTEAVVWRLVSLSGGADQRVRRHEALRTTFAEAAGSPVQVIAPFGGFVVRWRTCRG
jgi:hypothetical protein